MRALGAEVELGSSLLAQPQGGVGETAGIAPSNFRNTCVPAPPKAY